eukprot:6184945-Pleurochrysis_carterae.AAC.2
MTVRVTPTEQRLSKGLRTYARFEATAHACGLPQHCSQPQALPRAVDTALSRFNAQRVSGPWLLLPCRDDAVLPKLQVRAMEELTNTIVVIAER